MVDVGAVEGDRGLAVRALAVLFGVLRFFPALTVGGVTPPLELCAGGLFRGEWCRQRLQIDQRSIRPLLSKLQSQHCLHQLLVLLLFLGFLGFHLT